MTAIATGIRGHKALIHHPFEQQTAGAATAVPRRAAASAARLLEGERHGCRHQARHDGENTQAGAEGA
jgi:hypothetical protein